MLAHFLLEATRDCRLQRKVDSSTVARLTRFLTASVNRAARGHARAQHLREVVDSAATSSLDGTHLATHLRSRVARFVLYWVNCLEDLTDRFTVSSVLSQMVIHVEDCIFKAENIETTFLHHEEALRYVPLNLRE